jgi:hypothetical protein|tara:strand:- start:514 stop:1020 length:507 start_codon:yes stop_codon:yes gene_type:complete
MNSTSKFAKYFYRLINEDVGTGALGDGSSVRGGIYTANDPNSKDGYNTGSAVIAKPLGKKKKRVQKRMLPEGEEDNQVKQKFSKKYADKVEKEFAKHVRLRSPDGKLGVKLPPGNKKEIEDYKKKGYKEEEAEDRCKRKADSVYGKKTSAYKSGAIVRCRKGKIWKKK